MPSSRLPGSMAYTTVIRKRTLTPLCTKPSAILKYCRKSSRSWILPPFLCVWTTGCLLKYSIFFARATSNGLFWVKPLEHEYKENSMEALYEECKTRMHKALDNLAREFGRLRTGRASTSLVESIKVDYYGTPTPINQLASISIPDSRTIAIQPWDRNGFSGVEKAILKSDLGLNPVNDGSTIRI